MCICHCDVMRDEEVREGGGGVFQILGCLVLPSVAGYSSVLLVITRYCFGDDENIIKGLGIQGFKCGAM